jgi:hypothetical protein
MSPLHISLVLRQNNTLGASLFPHRSEFVGELPVGREDLPEAEVLCRPSPPAHFMSDATRKVGTTSSQKVTRDRFLSVASPWNVNIKLNENCEPF